MFVDIKTYLLEIAKDVIVNGASKALYSKLDSTQQCICLIDEKLSRIINAPYKASLYHLREGKINLAKEKLVDAISANSLNIPARLLYISLIINDNKEYASELYVELFEEFTTLSYLLPTNLYTSLAQTYNSCLDDLLKEKDFYISNSNGEPLEMWLNIHGYVILWNDFSLFRRKLLTFCLWDKSEYTMTKKRCTSVICVTDRYVFYKDGNRVLYFDCMSCNHESIVCDEMLLFSLINKVDDDNTQINPILHGMLNDKSGTISAGNFLCKPFTISQTEEEVDFYYDGEAVMKVVEKKKAEYHLYYQHQHIA